ncbi:hypothetical protein IQ260_17610 [Leptolyngbya cf. ectocarpi LEGE 11479]|uniref:Lipoprotein n=1 Tax=Leptolyngbya cf. ectocarpi LEGE 11479 TaxID=1828722 RepID=A0A928ZVZ3_LEPEC|nr:hypothetical protein [Leptolyngbya ectocarpi]MBE9068470.1 hypothetical protein [Leptolyngbya cf. ectocarpi LEGE 11479]
MFNIYRSRPLGSQLRQFVCVSTLVCVVLVGCAPREDCAFLNDALLEGNLRLQEVNEGNLGGSGYNQGIERQVGRIYFDVSQIIDSLPITNQRLQTIQFQLVEAYQQASDDRYQAADLLSSVSDNPSAQVKSDIRQLHLDSEANIGTITETLRKQCPLR